MARSSPRTLTGLGAFLGALVLELFLPVVLALAWWFGSAQSQSLYFPPLSDIVSSFHQLWLFSHVGSDLVPSLVNLLIGYVIACVIGIGAGLVLGTFRVVADAVRPILEFFRAVPGVALLPIAIILLGISADMRISVIVYGTVWPILLNTIDGVRGVDPVVRDVSAVYRLTSVQRGFRVVLPSAGPNIMAGMRTSLSLGITLIVVSEMVGSTNGIGYMTLQSQRSYDAPGTWAGILLLGILGYALNVGFRGIEHGVLRWHRGMHGARD